MPNLELETLILDGNPIEILDSNHSFPNITTLKELHMSNMSRLREIREGAIGNLGNLEVLIIENCTLLKNIDMYAFSVLVTRVYFFKTDADERAFNFNFPMTKHFSEIFHAQPEVGGRTWPRLKKLHLSNNALEYLPSGLLARWDQLEEMHVVNNPWSCDCENQHFVSLFRARIFESTRERSYQN